MLGCLSLFRKWRDCLPHEASDESEFRRTATSSHDASPPMEGSSSQKTFPSGIEELHKPDESTLDIVLIHGVTANRDATWTNKDTSDPWPGTLLPSIFPTARTLAFGYNTYVGDMQSVVLKEIIANHGWNLLSKLSSFRKNDCTDEKPIIFVCHGLGGLICKQALFTSSKMPEWEMHSVFCSTHGIAFLGTPLQPLHETSLTTLAEIVAQSIGLAKQKDNVNALKSGFKAVFSDNPTDFDIMQEARDARKLLPIKVVCFYAELPVEGSNFVLTRDSATLPGCTSVGIHKNHMDMTKFATLDDSGFIAVRETLGPWIKEVDATGSSADREPDTANQYGGNNRQYNNFGEGKQMIFGGSHSETKGGQSFILSEK